MALPLGTGYAFFGFSCDGDAEQMGFGFHFDNNSGGADPDTIAQTIYTAWSLGFDDGDYAVGYTLNGVEVKLGTADGDAIGYYLASDVGSFAVSALPVNCAFLVRKRSTRAGRHGVGRMYFPAGISIGEGDVSQAGGIDPAAVTALNADLVLFLDGLGAADVPMVILGSDGLTPLVTSLQCDPKIATQRRRLR